MTLFTGDIQKPRVFPGVENNSLILVSIIKAKASLMPLVTLGTRLSAAHKVV